MLLNKFQSWLSYSLTNPIDWNTDTIKVSLHRAAYTPNVANQQFFANVTNEVSGTNYTAGGKILTGITVQNANGLASVFASNPVWAASGSGFADARYAVLYKDTGTPATSPLVGYMDFVSDKGNDVGDLEINWAPAGVFTQATDDFAFANLAYSQANASYSLANTANTAANLAYGQANAAYLLANTANITGNLAYAQANAAYALANSANNLAASKVASVGGGTLITIDNGVPTAPVVNVNVAAAFSWTGEHSFRGIFGANAAVNNMTALKTGILGANASPAILFHEASSPANAKFTLAYVDTATGVFNIANLFDNGAYANNILSVTRVNTAINVMSYGSGTAQHTFVGTPNGRTILISGTNNMGLGLYNSTGGTNAKYWQMYSSTTVWRMGFVDDGLSAVNDILAANRTGYAVTNIFYGNATNNPGHTFYASAANQINVQGPSGQYVNLEMVANGGTAGSTGFVFGQASDGAGVIYNRSNAPAKIATNGTYRFIISAAGAIQFVTGYGLGDIRSDSSGNLTANAHFGDFGLQENHGTYTSFEASGFTMPYGCSFVQNTTNGPGISGATQYYHQRMGLGKEYCNQYAMDWAIPRTPSGGSPYMSVRFAEGGTWTAWSKIYAGFADTSTYSQHWWSTSHYGTYYLDNNWDGTYWNITSSHGAPTRVGYADYCNNASGHWTSAATDVGYGGNYGQVEVRNNGGSGDSALAEVSFHCQSAYGINLHLRNDGYFGLGGWSSAAWRWYSSPGGDMVAAGNVTAYSDARLKTNIRTINNALDQVARLRGVYFDWNNNPANANKSSKNSLGLIAQEIQQVFPELVTTGVDGDTLTVAYAPLVGVLVEAIKDLKAKVEQLEARQ